MGRYLHLILFNTIPIVGVVFLGWSSAGIYWLFFIEFFIMLIFGYWKIKHLQKEKPSDNVPYGQFLFHSILGFVIPGGIVYILSAADYRHEYWYMLGVPRVDNHLIELGVLILAAYLSLHNFKKEGYKTHESLSGLTWLGIYSISFVFIANAMMLLFPGKMEVWGAVVALIIYTTGREIIKTRLKYFL